MITTKTGMHNHHLLPCRDACHPSRPAKAAKIHPNGRLPIVNGATINPTNRRVATMPSFVDRFITFRLVQIPITWILLIAAVVSLLANK